MLKKKLNILLLILLSALFLGSFSTSCVMAYTFDDLVEYCTQIKNGEIASNNDYKVLATSFLNCVTNIRNSVNVNNYTNFVITERNDYDRNYILDMNNGCTVNDLGANYTNFRIDNITTPVWSCQFSYYATTISSIQSYSTINEIATKITETVGLVNAYNTHNRGLFNQYDPTPKLDFTPNSNINNITVNNYTGVNGVFYRVTENPIWRNY